jgi:hypothetical protein
MTIANLYVLSVREPNFIKHKVLNLKIQMDINIIIVGDLNALL